MFLLLMKPFHNPALRCIISITFLLAWASAIRIQSNDFPASYLFHGNSTLSFNGSTPFATVVPSQPSSTGSVWLSSQLNVSLGFELQFQLFFDRFPNFCLVQTVLEVSANSQHLNCLPSAGDGLAIVIQSSIDPKLVTTLVGVSGSGIGYANLTAYSPSSSVPVASLVAIEFDTNSNGDLKDAHDNHVAVQLAPSADHVFTAGMMPLPVNLKNETAFHNVTVTYVPVYHRRIVRSKNYQSTTLAFETMPNNEQLGRQTETVGFIQVYVDQRKEPDLAVPVDLTQVLSLVNGTNAYIGFTAGTGERYHRVSIKNIQYCERNPANVLHNKDWRGFYCS